jgi:hypothetical protein
MAAVLISPTTKTNKQQQQQLVNLAVEAGV